MNEAQQMVGRTLDRGISPAASASGMKGRDQPAPTAEEMIRCVRGIASEGDREAFSTLFRHFAPRLKTFFLRGGATPGVAEDLAQEAMLSLWRKAASFDPARAGVATWLFTIARNLRIDQLRREPRPLPLEPEEMPPTLEEAMLGEERDRLVREALVELSAEQVTVLRMSFYAERSQSEIASELGIPLGTVKSRVRLAMNRLRAVLGELQ